MESKYQSDFYPQSFYFKTCKQDLFKHLTFYCSNLYIKFTFFREFSFFTVGVITDVPHCLPFPLPPSPHPSHRPSPHSCLCSWALHICIYVCWLIFSSPSHPCHSEIHQSVPFLYASGLILFISLFCSLDSTYE